MSGSETLASLGEQIPGSKSLGEQNPEFKSLGEQNPGPKSLGEQSPGSKSLGEEIPGKKFSANDEFEKMKKGTFKEGGLINSKFNLESTHKNGERGFISDVKISGTESGANRHMVLGKNTEKEGIKILENVDGIGVFDEEINYKEGMDGEKNENFGIFSYFDFYFNENGAGAFGRFRQEYDLKTIFEIALSPIVLTCYLAYVIAVIVIQSDIQDEDFWCSGDGFLYVLTLFVGFFLVYFKIIKKYFGKSIERKFLQPLGKKFSKAWNLRLVKYSFYLILIVGVVVFYVIDTADERRRLISFIGLFFLIGFGFLFSFAPRKIVWRSVIWGLSIQFILALIVLRWPLGNKILSCLADKVTEFLNFSLQGAIFVFGPLADPCRIFAFSVLPVTIFFGFCTSILYYYGAVQWMVIKLGWCLQVTIGTNLCESMNAAGSIFLGMTESPLLIKPYLPIMTNSEFHAVMTAGFATVSGSVLAAYISMGADPALLITASVMNAPAALAISKLFYPELSKSKIDAKTISGFQVTEVNALHAGCVGITNAIPLVANIAANLIAFISFIAFFNAVFDWSCQLVNIDEGTCSLEGAFGYIFMPLAWMIGVQWSDCYKVGQLLGLKIIINEFVAYSQLSEFIKDGVLSARSISLATFALCGFGNISSVGIMMGGLGPLAPERKNDMARIAFRAMIAGSMATFSSACFAGTLLSYSDEVTTGNATKSPVSSVLSLHRILTSLGTARDGGSSVCNSTIC